MAETPELLAQQTGELAAARAGTPELPVQPTGELAAARAETRANFQVGGQQGIEEEELESVRILFCKYSLDILGGP